MTDSVRDKVIAILADQAVLEPDQVRMESTLGELGIDSLGLVETVYAIEETFDIEVPFNANEPSRSEFDISNVASIVLGVENLISAQN
jgi:acyl carrier protein